MYFDVQDVRTADDALIVVKLMIFFEIANIELMLDQTHDPVADFINALSADIIDFVAGHTFEAFKENTEKLNDLATYRMLLQRAGTVGYRVNKVVYRGYHATDALQAMHDNAIEVRTKLKLESDTENQAQELADFKLKKEAERAEQKRKIEEESVNHQNRMKKLVHDEKIRQEKLQKEMEQRGIYVKSVSFSGLAEEAGPAYKDIDEVIDVTHQAGLSSKVVKFLPIGNVKG